MEKYEDIFVTDKLNIKSDVISFAHLIEQDKYQENGTAKVYAINAGFGIGKTFFCERLKDVLATDGVRVTKMNIWEMDFYENPLIPILIKLQEVYKTANPKKLDFPVPRILLRCFKSVVSSITVEAKDPLTGSVKIEGSKFVETNEKLKAIEKESDIYSEYQAYKSELDKIKEFLENWAKGSDSPIVVIIDELDRCRPDYAVKTLEVLKHFFEIPGFVFVLATDEDQLKNSVKCLFGTENFDGYKRKFINNSFLLPKPDKKAFTEYLYEKSGIDGYIKKIQDEDREFVFHISYTDHMNTPGIQTYEMIAMNMEERKFNDTQNSKDIIITYFAAYSKWFGFTLRQMEQVFDRLFLFVKQISSSNELFSPDLSTLLVCLHEFNIDVFNNLKEHSGSSGSVYSFISEKIRTNLKDKNANQDKIRNAVIGSMQNNLEKFPVVTEFSCEPNISNQPIKNNVDRFFTNAGMIWINGKIKIQTNERLYDSENVFHLQKFKETYFAKMDFLSRFD